MPNTRKILEIAYKINKSAEPVLEMVKTMPPVMFQLSASEAFTALAKLSQAINATTKLYTNPFDKIVSLANAVSKLEEGMESLVLICIEQGWYPVRYIPIHFSPTENAFEHEMAALIEKYIDEIENDLCINYPHRSSIIKEAFSAHRSGAYAVGIPTLLAQANGICEERLGVDPFSRNDKNGKRLEDKVPESTSTEFFRLYFEPLRQAKSIRAHSSTVFPTTLNRHAVLHGSSTEYPTHINSLKAISYIGSLDWLLQDQRMDEEEEKE